MRPQIKAHAEVTFTFIKTYIYIHTYTHVNKYSYMPRHVILCLTHLSGTHASMRHVLTYLNTYICTCAYAL